MKDRKVSGDVSAAASAAAVAMRRFDAGLTDADLQRIAQAIDDNAAGAELHKKKHRLRNADDLAIIFEADPQ